MICRNEAEVELILNKRTEGLAFFGAS